MSEYPNQSRGRRNFVYNALAFTVLCCPSIAAANDQPLGIIKKMYSDFLTNNNKNAINSKKNRSRYFVPALVKLYDADDERACVAGIEATGQEVNAAQIRKTLSIAQTSNDGVHAEVVSKVANSGQLEIFRYEFLKGNTCGFWVTLALHRILWPTPRRRTDGLSRPAAPLIGLSF